MLADTLGEEHFLWNESDHVAAPLMRGRIITEVYGLHKMKPRTSINGSTGWGNCSSEIPVYRGEILPERDAK
jgi:hypothetical protein